MRVIVQKYGGSSVGDLARIQAVATRVMQSRAEDCGIVVVVSAMKGETDRLLALAQEVSPSPERRELDMLLSTGERTSMALLALALCARGVPAVSLTGSQSGIITDESHADARVVEVRPARILDELARGKVVVVGGFQGVSRTREITTLGRGGSDTTAVVLAAALKADYVEICSDVDGVWSADPRMVPEARPIASLSISRALDLARAGAKVLYEDAVRCARDLGVEIVASSTFGPGSGTRIQATSRAQEAAVAVTLDDQLIKLTLGPDPQALLAQVAQRGGRVRKRVGDVIYVDVRNAHGAYPDAPRVAVITAIGTALGECVEASVAGERAIAEAGGRVLHVGGAGDVLWWEVSFEARTQALRGVHGIWAGVDPTPP